MGLAGSSEKPAVTSGTKKKRSFDVDRELFQCASDGSVCAVEMSGGTDVVGNLGERRTRRMRAVGEGAPQRSHDDAVSASELSYLISLYAAVAVKKAPVLKDLLKEFCCLRHHVPLMNHV